MGTRALPLTVALLATLGGVGGARADDCQGQDADGGVFAICFDPGNRVYASAATDGLGLGLEVRHTASTDDPDVYWRLEHGIAQGLATRAGVDATLYAGRYLRHSRDGHLLLPGDPPRRLFLPFDVGAEVRVGRLERRFGDEQMDVGVIRAAMMLELTRSAHFRRRLSMGPVLRWDAVLPADVSGVTTHRVTPLSAGVVDGYLESADGLTLAQVRVEAGSAWSDGGWDGYLVAEARLERVVLAIWDQPLSLFARASHRRGAVARSGLVDQDGGTWQAGIGARFALSWAHPGAGGYP